MKLEIWNRETQTIEGEKVYGEKSLNFLYKSWLGLPFRHLATRYPFVSAFYGWWMSRSFTRQLIAPFIQKFGLDPAIFRLPVSDFASFNAFFTRELKPEARPIASTAAVMPADGRYWFYPSMGQAEGFVVKRERFDLPSLLQDEALAARYADGTMIMARLCPTDYHRFHFPIDCVPGPTCLINGYLYSVNPIAIQQDLSIFTQNKRTLCSLQSETFGEVLFLEIGATNVGSIHQTYTPNRKHLKGEEKGYFSFGASALILLFRKGVLTLAPDLTPRPIETLCLMGQSLSN